MHKDWNWIFSHELKSVSSLRGARGAVTLPNECFCTPPPISVYLKYVFGTLRNDKTTDNNGKRNSNFKPEVESSRTSLASRTSSRTHFEVLGLGLEASSPRKLACPRLEDSSIFRIVKILWSPWKIFWKTFFSGDRLKNFCEDLFFFWRALALESLVLGLGLEHSCPWPRECLSSERLSLALALASDFFLCPWTWPWPRALCPRLYLCFKHNSRLKLSRFFAKLMLTCCCA